EDRASTLKKRGLASVALSALGAQAPRVVVHVYSHIAAHKEIEPAIVVVIEKSGARAEIRPGLPIGVLGNPRLSGDIDKSAAAVSVADIVIQNVGLAVAREK